MAAHLSLQDARIIVVSLAVVIISDGNY